MLKMRADREGRRMKTMLLMHEADVSPPGQDQRGGQEVIPTSVVGFYHLALKVGKDSVGD